MPQYAFTFPADFRPDGRNELIRLGTDHSDGGYIIAADIPGRIGHVVTFGLGYNWDFERDVHAIAPSATIHCYDHTVYPAKVIVKMLWAAVRLPFKPWKRKRMLRTTIDYFRFFGAGKPARHFMQMVGTTDGPKETTVAAAFARLPKDADTVFLKCDIEGGEYPIADDLVAVAPRCLGIGLEFHDSGKKLDVILDMVRRLRHTHYLDHLHINNNSVPDDHGIPTVIELTFSRKDVAPDGASLPASAADFARAHDGVALDVPNNPNIPEMTALYR